MEARRGGWQEEGLEAQAVSAFGNEGSADEHALDLNQLGLITNPHELGFENKDFGKAFGESSEAKER